MIIGSVSQEQKLWFVKQAVMESRNTKYKHMPHNTEGFYCKYNLTPASSCSVSSKVKHVLSAGLFIAMDWRFDRTRMFDLQGNGHKILLTIFFLFHYDHWFSSHLIKLTLILNILFTIIIYFISWPLIWRISRSPAMRNLVTLYFWYHSICIGGSKYGFII